jgi:hypothetical protein
LCWLRFHHATFAVLEKDDLKPWLKQAWVMPTVGAEVVWRMEALLDLYAEPCDPARPVVGCDQSSKQLVAETRLPLPLEPGHPERFDTEY